MIRRGRPADTLRENKGDSVGEIRGGSDAVTAAIGAVVVCQSYFQSLEALFTLQLNALKMSFSYRRHRSDNFKPVLTEKKFPKVASPLFKRSFKALNCGPVV